MVDVLSEKVEEYLWEYNCSKSIGRTDGRSLINVVEEFVDANDVIGLTQLLKKYNNFAGKSFLDVFFVRAANLGYVDMCNVFLKESDVAVDCLFAGYLSEDGREIAKNILGFCDEILDLLLKECYMKRRDERQNIFKKFKEKFLLNDVISNKESLSVVCHKV